MKLLRLAVAAILILALAGCAEGNVKTADDYDAPPPPPIAQPTYNPYAAYGEAHAIWQPPVVDRSGGIVKPEEPATDWDRQNYEGAPWASGAKPSPFGGPPGTF